MRKCSIYGLILKYFNKKLNKYLQLWIVIINITMNLNGIRLTQHNSTIQFVGVNNKICLLFNNKNQCILSSLIYLFKKIFIIQN